MKVYIISLEMIPMNIVSVFCGQEWFNDDIENRSDIVFALSLCANVTFPSAFGLVINRPELVLKGEYKPNSFLCLLEETSVLDEKHQRSYALTISLKNGVLLLQGAFKEGQKSGTMILREENVEAGLFLGEAVPDASLEPFMIPVNPIKWLLCLIDDKLHGCGFFDDSADVKGQAVLLFRINGSCQFPNLKFVKIYEAVPSGETKGLEVEYEGLFQENQIFGTWKNLQSLAHGTFKGSLLFT